MASVTNSTIRQYNLGLKLWGKFCQERKIHIFNISVPLVLDFLTSQYKRGASYGTLNSFRSAISQISSTDFSQDVRLKRFFKGVFSLRPTRAKYDITWDPSIVLNYFRNLSIDKISLKDISYKLATLLALTTGHRVQTIANIEICNIEKFADHLQIKIVKRIKTSGPNRSQPTILLPFFHTDPKICVAKTLLYYSSITKELRASDCQNLFIAFKKPHKAVSTQTISRWIKITLDKCGLDTNLFTAHSTRHAATSAAARKGVNIDVIRRSVGWSKKSETFANFYQRPLAKKHGFLEAVLNS